jgi:hypothetical protein
LATSSKDKKERKMQHVRELLEQEIETLATQTTTVISANTAAASKWDFGFQTFGEAKLCEMLGAAKDFIRDVAIGTAPRWLSFLGQSGTGKTGCGQTAFGVGKRM